MSGCEFSLILLPTLRCNADCAYCFENKSDVDLDLDQLNVILRKLLDYMDEEDIESATVNWQGGEVMPIAPTWFERAHEMIQTAAQARSKRIEHGLQSNLIGYSSRWNRVIFEMFGGAVGSSVDYPNLYRKLANGSPADFDQAWLRSFRAATEAGIHVGVISIPNRQTFELGAERFHHYFVDELGVTDFQINTPFAGGPPTAAKRDFPLDPGRLGQFLVDLADIWADRSYEAGVKIGPFDELLRRFSNEPAVLPCIWHENCVDGFVCIDPRGWVSQCDCWVASYPEHRFGNILGGESLATLLERSPARRRLHDRPAALIRREDCIECDHLAHCHGGCPIRAYTHRGDLYEKDPYCETYRMVFDHMRAIARRIHCDQSAATPRSQ